MRLLKLNPIKTADILITLTWELISDGLSSEDLMKLLLDYLNLINQNDVIFIFYILYYII